MIYKNALELIGNTPLIGFNDLNDKQTNIYIKLEKFNTGGSVKDRIAYEIISQSESNGLLTKDKTLLEPTSGNTGIGLAMVGAIKGYKVILVMPDNMTQERVDLMKAYGAEIIFTDSQYGMKGAIAKANEIYSENPNSYFLPLQFENEFNVKVHYENTAMEIANELESIDALVLGVGTSGTLSGIGSRFKELYPDIKIFAVEPLSSSVLSGENPGKHKIQGIGAGFIPSLYNANLVTDIVRISDEEAFETARWFAKNKGLLLGISSGANLAATLSIANQYNFKHIVTLAPDGGEKYLSTELYK